MMTGKKMILGEHKKALCSLKVLKEHQCLLSGSWDQSIKLWDTRVEQNLVSSFGLGHKVFSLDVSGSRVLVGQSERLISLLDLRYLKVQDKTSFDKKEDRTAILEERKSPLKYLTRQVKLMTSMKGQSSPGFAISSIEGRIGIEYFQNDGNHSSSVKNKYCFKCHRVKTDEEEFVYPVHTLDFHPR